MVILLTGWYPNGNGDDKNQMCKMLYQEQAEKFELLLRTSVALLLSVSVTTKNLKLGYILMMKKSLQISQNLDRLGMRILLSL
jgi:hypothetical protein